MVRTSIAIAMFLFSCLIQAKEVSSLYQIDLIVFIHQQASSLSTEPSLSSTLSFDNSHAIPLQTETSKHLTPYHLLPSSSSQLRQEYWALHRKPQYRVLFHYTWLQPHNSQRPVALPKINRDGWQVEGTLGIRQANYYLLNTELLFSAPNSSQTPFVLAQKQRLQDGDTYYLDHPQAGMLIKVHQITTK